MGPTLRNRWHMLRVRADIAIARGEEDLAQDILTEVGVFSPHRDEQTQEWTNNARLRLAWHLLRGEPLTALDVLEAALDDPPLARKAMLAGRLLASVRYVCDAAAPIAPDRVAHMRELGDRLAVNLGDGPVNEAFGLVYRGEFDAAAEAWQRLGRPHVRAKALLHGAMAAAASGDREGASARLREACPLAVALHATPWSPRSRRWPADSALLCPRPRRPNPYGRPT
ncbi:hypothetical protein GCM10027612_16970 [Microbispora bryophytorum subsp. camponoti]